MRITNIAFPAGNGAARPADNNSSYILLDFPGSSITSKTTIKLRLQLTEFTDTYDLNSFVHAASDTHPFTQSAIPDVSPPSMATTHNYAQFDGSTEPWRFRIGLDDSGGNNFTLDATVQIEQPYGSGTWVDLDTTDIAITPHPDFLTAFTVTGIAVASCFWTELAGCSEVCDGGEFVSVQANNGYCDLDENQLDPIPAEFVTGDDFTIVLDAGLGDVLFTDWDVGLQRYSVNEPGALVDGQSYAGVLEQGANSWPCTFYFTFD